VTKWPFTYHLSNEAQAEARLLMLASNNILNPKDGKPVVTPSQDMVLGNYYLTIEDSYSEARVFNGYRNEERRLTFGKSIETKVTSLKILMKHIWHMTKKKLVCIHASSSIQNRINHAFTEAQKNKYLVTTVGKLIFNRILPETFYYLQEPTLKNLEEGTPDIYFIAKGVNPKEALKQIPVPAPFKKRFLSLIIAQVFKQLHISETSRMLDRLKDLGFKYSTVAGITVSFADINVYSGKEERIGKANDEIEKITEWYEDGLTHMLKKRTCH
jgi:DNA-directed RNA polymerase subunit beta'